MLIVSKVKLYIIWNIISRGRIMNFKIVEIKYTDGDIIITININDTPLTFNIPLDDLIKIITDLIKREK